MKLLDDIKVDPRSMSVLDHELEAFCKYVQLSDKEIQTRDNLIQTIRNEARERFGIRDSDVKIFGSYAARPVCTFESDVDLVIWGLMEEQYSPWKPDVEEIPVQKETASLPPRKEPQAVHPNMKKQYRILEWKSAIEESEKKLALQASEKNEVGTESRPEPKKKPEVGGSRGVKDDGSTETTASNSESPSSESGQFEDADEKSSTNENAGDDKEEAPFFVIDRVGDESSSSLAGESSEAKAGTTEDSAPLSPKENAATDVNSDDDTADKLEGLKSKEESADLDISGEGNEFPGLALLDALGEGACFTIDDEDNDDEEDEDDEQEEALLTTPKTRKRSHSLISLSSATTCGSDSQM
ncbi:MAG: hypothetical protein SGBAC_008125, partial [Bacillariaceae sp.]